MTHLGYQLGLIHSIFLEHMFMLIPSRYTTYYTVFYRTSFSSGFFFIFFNCLFLGECQQLVNFWHKSSPFSFPAIFMEGNEDCRCCGVLSREFVRVAVAACATDVDFFVVCAYLFVTAFIGSTLLFALLLYCAFSFCYRNNFKIFSCWQTFSQ